MAWQYQGDEQRPGVCHGAFGGICHPATSLTSRAGTNTSYTPPTNLPNISCPTTSACRLQGVLQTSRTHARKGVDPTNPGRDTWQSLRDR